MELKEKGPRRRSQQLDEFDRQILAILEEDARRPTAEIARAVGLSGPTTAERIARMRDIGLIQAFTIRLDPAKLGLAISAIIEFEPHDNADAKAMAAVVGHPAVRSCFKVTGPALLNLIVHAVDGAELHNVLLEFARHGSTKTSVILTSELADMPFFADRPDVVPALLKRSNSNARVSVLR